MSWPSRTSPAARDEPRSRDPGNSLGGFRHARGSEIPTVQTLTSVAPSPDEERLQLRKVPTLELAPQSARTFLILLGRGRHQRSFKCIDALIRFVRSDLLPQDRVAVFAYNRATDFTTDHEQIGRVLEQYKKLHENIELWCATRLGGLAAVYGNREIPSSWQSQIDKIFEVSGGPGFPRVPPRPDTEQQRKMAEEAREIGDSLLGVPEVGVNVKALNDILDFDQFASTFGATNQDVQNIFTAIEYMRFVEGRKHLLFFTENGVFLPRIELRIYASKVRFQKSGGLNSDKLKIAMFFTDSRGNYLGDDWQTMDMNLREETYQRVVREGIPNSVLIPLRGTMEMLKIVVYDCGADKVGSVVKNLR